MFKLAVRMAGPGKNGIGRTVDLDDIIHHFTMWVPG